MDAGTATHVVPAGHARALRIARGAEFRVVNPHGGQVVDAWAYIAADNGEFLSMEHSRLHLGRLVPRVGDALVSNRRRPLLTLVADTSGGRHDTLLAACDRWRYALLGAPPGHRNCADNLAQALRAAGVAGSGTPAPFNLFECVDMDSSGKVEIVASTCPPGGYVTLRAELDLVVVLSACPQDLAPTNGVGRAPRDIELVAPVDARVFG